MEEEKNELVSTHSFEVMPEAKETHFPLKNKRTLHSIDLISSTHDRTWAQWENNETTKIERESVERI